MMDHLRTLAALGLAAVAMTACDPAQHAAVRGDVRGGMAEGRAAAAGWAEAARGAGEPIMLPAVATLTPPDTAAVMALGYLERLRLGLGSPFRLAELALTDPRLDGDTRQRLGWALLAATAEGRAYEIDPAALDRVGAPGLAAWPGLGARHLAFIEEVIQDAADPRGGELAVRLAYTLAQGEGRIPERGVRLATQAAALLRDRELARADVLRLLRASAITGESPLELLPRWRSERRFAVEAALAAAPGMAAEREALGILSDVRRQLAELGAGAEALARGRPGPPEVRASLLRPGAAALLADIAAAADPPPQTPVAVPLRALRRDILEYPDLPAEELERRNRFVAEGLNEERFVAERARVTQVAPYDVGPSLAALGAAVALRVYAQEGVWHPGFAGPSARDLEDRFGLGAVSFGEDVPDPWRPYYRRMLSSALEDLTTVLPTLDLRGLRVRIAAPPGREGALALHEPRTRTLVLPPMTGSGTLAHELAHDLDWQVALRRYRVRGDYASDRAVRLGGDRLATWVQDLASASLDPAEPVERQAHANRPAENFARSVDRFVTTSLAASGRMNGYLSSIQDDLLTGYGTVRPPDITGSAGNALLTILAQVAPVQPDTRAWFLRAYGSQRSVTPYDLVRLVLEAPMHDAASTGPDEAHALTAATAARARLDAVERARLTAQGAIDAWACRAAGFAHDRAREGARRRLVDEAAAVRARALLVELGQELGGREGRWWVQRRLFGGTRDGTVDEGLAEVLLPLVERVRSEGARPGAAPPASGFLMRPPAACAPALVAPTPR
ncbi:MAG: hypothetical protein WEB88_11085 [Gemmatimonadota bacterium]